MCGLLIVQRGDEWIGSMKNSHKLVNVFIANMDNILSLHSSQNNLFTHIAKSFFLVRSLKYLLGLIDLVGL